MINNAKIEKEMNALIAEYDAPAIALLKRAADKLQDYCQEMNGDINDSLAMTIYRFIAERTASYGKAI